MTAELLNRPRRADETARRAEIRLEAELGRRAPELKLEMSPAVLCATYDPVAVHVIVVGPAAIALLIVAPSVARIATTGIMIGVAPATVGFTNLPRCCRG